MSSRPHLFDVSLTSRFERELERLRKEMELASATGSSTSGPTPSNPGTPYVPGEAGDTSSGSLGLDASPLVLPEPQGGAGEQDVPDLDLDTASQVKQKSL